MSLISHHNCNIHLSVDRILRAYEKRERANEKEEDDDESTNSDIDSFLCGARMLGSTW